MKKIEEIDKNFIVKDSTVKDGTRIYNVCEAPFSVHGLFLPDNSFGEFYRMNKSVAECVNDGVEALNLNCSGGRVRFKTDSSYIAVKAVMDNIGKMPHFALTGSAGFDLYCCKKHIATFQPKFDITNELFGEYVCTDCGLREYTLNFPLYSGVKELYIILNDDAVLQEAAPYKISKPVVFYGSSITQGGCASRPGTAYPSIVSRNLDFDYINFGFSGSAFGEENMAEYIANLDMSAFVYDYDHNAPTYEHLNKTHKKFLDIVRKKHPYIPIICVCEPTHCHSDHEERKQIIVKSVLTAVQNGDKNIYFLDMYNFLRGKGILEEASVDGCHPNDLGFFFMGEAIENMLEELL